MMKSILNLSIGLGGRQLKKKRGLKSVSRLSTRHDKEERKKAGI